ncbi:MAG: SDR family oxidoreductase [Nitriliruptorales bacterium]|nr:SDR family oxidoreductase [Nitriliruptorales bacterium]
MGDNTRTGAAIVTASDSGIGKATAVALANAGYDIGITWHSDDEGAKGTAEEVQRAGRHAEVRHLDLSRPDTARATIDDLAAALKGLDVLVNNAGRGGAGAFLQTSLEDWNDVLSVNLTGAFLCAQAAARRMVTAGSGGRIVNVTSVHEHVPLEGSSAYCASKGGLGLLTKVMALELAEHGITVNAVAPGEIATEMTGNEDVDPRRVDRRGIPAGRPGNAHEIAAAITYLVSPAAAYTTGHSMVVDGGLLLMAAQANAKLKPD